MSIGLNLAGTDLIDTDKNKCVYCKRLNKNKTCDKNEVISIVDIRKGIAGCAIYFEPKEK